MDGRNSAYGLTINLTFNGTPTYLDPSGVDRTDDLIPIMQAAADIWEDIIEDSYMLDITYQWGDLGGTTAGFNSWIWDTGNRVDSGTITFDTIVGGSARRWFFDESPLDDSKYAMTQTLYRNVPVDNQSGGTTPWFNGSSPEVFEASYRGTALASAPADAQFGLDLLSVALHELGHAIGVPGTSNGLGDNVHDIQSNQVGGATMGILTAPNGHLSIANSNMFPGINPGERQMVSAADVLAAASTSVWTNIDLQRQDFIAAGNGSENWIAANWMGNQVPGSADDAFIRSQDFNPTVELVGTQFARNLFIGDGDNLSTNAFKMDVGQTATIDGTYTDVFVDTGGELEANEIVVQNGAALLAYGGLVDVSKLEIKDGSFLFGKSGDVFISQSIVNNGVIATSAGDLLVRGTGTQWDLDGTSGNGVLSANSGNLSLQMQSPLNDDFNGTIEVGQGHWMLSFQPFRLAPGATVQMNGGSTTGNEAQLFVNLTLASSTATINVDGIAYSQAPFEMINGSVNLTSGATLEFKGASVVSGGTFNVPSSSAVVRFQSDTQLSGGTFSTTGTGQVQLNGPTDYAGGTLNVVGRVHQNGNATVSAATTINGSGSWDLDGNAGGDTVWDVNDDFTLNVARIESGSGSQDFGGRINLNGSGTTMTVNTPIPWTMSDRLDINDGAVLAGSAKMNVTGTVNVESGRIDSPVEFRSGSSVVIDSGNILRLNGTTNYMGGAYRGGILYQNGTANVLADTTLGNNVVIYPPAIGPPTALLWLEQFDWDGAGGTGKVTNIFPGTVFTINAEKIDSSPDTDGYDGTVNINGGTLIVNTGDRVYAAAGIGGSVSIVTPTLWRLDGTMNLQEVDGNTAIVASQYGSPLQVYGDVNALGGDAAIAGMAVTLTPGGQINVSNGATLSMGLVAEGGIDIHPGGLLRLSSSSALQSTTQMVIDGAAELTSSTAFQGGSYQGNGTLRLQGAANFNETTLFEVNAEFSTGGTNTIAASKELHLANDARIEAGAVFQGDGRLHNLAGSELSLANGADVGVLLINDGTLTPGSSPGVAIVEKFFQAAIGALEIEIFGDGGVPGVDFDQLVVNQYAILGGVLNVSLVDGFLPATGNTFDILDWSTHSYTFDEVNLPPGYVWNLDYGTSTLILEVLAVLGDMNGDNVLTDADVNLFVEALTNRAAYNLHGYGVDADTVGDVNQDGNFNLGDVGAFKALLTQPGTSAAQSVPEPSTLLLTIVSFALLLSSGRKNSYVS